MAALMLLMSLMSLSAVVSHHRVGAQVRQSSYQVCDCDPYYSLGCLCVSQGSCDKSKYIVGTIPDLDFEEMDVLTYCRGIEICCRIPAAPQQSTSTTSTSVTNATTVTPTTSTTTTTTTTETPTTVTPTTSTTTTTTTTTTETPTTVTPTTSTTTTTTTETPTTVTPTTSTTTTTTTTESPRTVTPTTSTTTTETPTTSSSTTTSTTTIRTGPAAPRIGNNRMLNLDATTPPATPTTSSSTSTNTSSSTTSSTTTSSSSSNYTECGLLRNAAAALPWVAALFKTSQQDGARSFLCPVSIVHPSVVMTAGGCLTPVSVNDSLSVVAGLTDAGGDGNGDASATQRQELQVEKVVRSEYFDPSKAEFDFMLLQLVAPFTRSPSVDVVCLPQPDTSLDLDRCISAGFSPGSSDGTLRQRQTNVVVRNSSVCESKLWDIIGEDFVLPIGMTCAEGPSLCQSTPLTFQEDYGGPVTCPLVPDPTRFVQVGILSKPLSTCGGSAGGDTDDVPALMTSASFFSPTIQWILADMVSENYAVHPAYSKNNQ